MKKCPFCAEEIQVEAIKCKHCGEWLEDKGFINSEKPKPEREPKEAEQENEVLIERTPCFDEACTGTVNNHGICSECGRSKQEIEDGIQSKAEAAVKLVPIKKPWRNLGWGWIIICLSYIRSAQYVENNYLKYDESHSLILYFIPLFGFVATLFVYFKMRRFFIGKTNIQTKIWPASLKAGVLAFFFMVLLNAITVFTGNILN